MLFGMQSIHIAYCTLNLFTKVKKTITTIKGFLIAHQQYTVLLEIQVDIHVHRYVHIL